MGTLERKEREREVKRANMLEAAEALILQKGLEHLNMDELLRRRKLVKVHCISILIVKRI